MRVYLFSNNKQHLVAETLSCGVVTSDPATVRRR